MCLIIHRPVGCEIPARWLENAMSHNSDGWGIMASIDGILQIRKGLASKKFKKNLAFFDGHEVFIHFRYATHGGINVDNCHPFTIVNGEYAVMHNGVIGIDTKENAARSDSWHWSNRVLAPILNRIPCVADPILTPWIEKNVGTANKIVVLRSNGDYTIANHAQGTMMEGCWLSNVYSIAPVRHYRSVSKATAWQWEWTDKYAAPKKELAVNSNADFINDSTDDDLNRDVPIESHESLDLEEVSRMDVDEIATLCEQFPEEMARAIQDHFDWQSWR